MFGAREVFVQQGNQDIDTMVGAELVYRKITDKNSTERYWQAVRDHLPRILAVSPRKLIYLSSRQLFALIHTLKNVRRWE